MIRKNADICVAHKSFPYQIIVFFPVVWFNQDGCYPESKLFQRKDNKEPICFRIRESFMANSFVYGTEENLAGENWKLTGKNLPQH